MSDELVVADLGPEPSGRAEIVVSRARIFRVGVGRPGRIEGVAPGKRRAYENGVIEGAA
jgi:hypothetical protein